MGCILYDFLADSLLLAEKGINESFSRESSIRVEKELVDCRNFCLNNMDKLRGEIDANARALSVFTSASDTPHFVIETNCAIPQPVRSQWPLFHYTDLSTPTEKAISTH